jgi:hypothetical protein
MIAIAHSSCRSYASSEIERAFEQMLPQIEKFAGYAFRRFPRLRRRELVADVVATAYVAFVRLVERGLKALAYPSALARFAICRVRAGRDVGSRHSVRDALSPLAQRHQGFSVRSLSECTSQTGWQELAEGRKSNPAEVASCRVDFGIWLDRLGKFKRDVALRLAAGDTTTEAARYFRVTPARISQLRQELLTNWNAFQVVPAVSQ